MKIKQIFAIIMMFSVIGCDGIRDGTATSDDIHPRLEITSLSYFSPFGYEKKITFTADNGKVIPEIKSDKALIQYRISDTTELDDILQMIQENIVRGYEVGEHEIGHRAIDAGGLVIKWKGRIINVYNDKGDVLDIYDQKIVDGIKKLKSFMYEFDTEHAL